jgi:hypothetical protein
VRGTVGLRGLEVKGREVARARRQQEKTGKKRYVASPYLGWNKRAQYSESLFGNRAATLCRSPPPPSSSICLQRPPPLTTQLLPTPLQPRLLQLVALRDAAVAAAAAAVAAAAAASSGGGSSKQQQQQQQQARLWLGDPLCVRVRGG